MLWVSLGFIVMAFCSKRSEILMNHLGRHRCADSCSTRVHPTSPPISQKSPGPTWPTWGIWQNEQNPRVQEISLMLTQWHNSKGGIREIPENYMDAKSQIWVKYSKITKLCRFFWCHREPPDFQVVKALLLQRESHRRHWARPGIWPSKRSWPQHHWTMIPLVRGLHPIQ